MNEHISIPGLPPPEIYELEYEFWPWGKLINLVEDWVVENAPHGGLVADFMCGTGFLLNGIANRRPDLQVYGCAVSEEEIAFGKCRYPQINLECADALSFEPPGVMDIAITTGGIHHLQPLQQQQFVGNVRGMLNASGHFIVGEEVVPRSTGESERRLGTVKLGTALLSYVIERGAPDLVTEAAVNILKRDLFCAGEYKTCLQDLVAMLQNSFIIESCCNVWPSSESEYGDFLFVCRPKR